MKLLSWLTESFIATFGITRPRPEQEKLTNLMLGGFLLAHRGSLWSGGISCLFDLYQVANRDP